MATRLVGALAPFDPIKMQWTSYSESVNPLHSKATIKVRFAMPHPWESEQCCPSSWKLEKKSQLLMPPDH